MIVLYSGGVKSGKSLAAENALEGLPNSVYIATSEITDQEHAGRVERHKQQRAGKFDLVIEKKHSLSELDFKNSNIMIECLTTWLANEMFTKLGTDEEISDRIISAIEKMNYSNNKVIIITNDVFNALGAHSDSTKRYLYLFHRITKDIISMSDEVYEVVCGIVKRRK